MSENLGLAGAAFSINCIRHCLECFHTRSCEYFVSLSKLSVTAVPIPEFLVLSGYNHIIHF